MNEIRFHGRGGQGAVTAVRILASAAVKEGKYAAAFPMYGVERRGVPVAAFLRIDDQPIRERTQVYEPNCLVVLDPHLIERHPKDVFAGLKPDSILVTNASRPNIRLESPFVGLIGFVDGTRIGLEEIGAAITNTCMMGAFARATGLLGLNSILDALCERFEGLVLDKNIRCAKRGFAETTISRL
jgi:pyruvate ferredoxin oxidoreductase gamma subunit/2-oxoisovalerate ferredoxin oxidoreductase gamma subunit